MASLIIRRIALAIPVVFIVSALVFFLQSLTPGDAARTILGTGGTQEQYEQLRAQLGLDLPVWQQYLDYMAGVFRGDLGSSFRSGTPVAELIAARLPASLSLIVLSTIVATVIGVLLGTLSARQGGGLGRVVDGISLAGLALPNFWIALVLVTVFAVQLKVLPAVGYVPLTQSVGGWLVSLVLPVTALAVGAVAVVAKTTRDSMMSVLERDYIRNLRGAGVSAGSILWRHGLRNAATPVLAVVNIVFIGALAGTVFVETVFAIPGLGNLMVVSVSGGEFKVIQGVALVFTLAVVVVNLLVDVAAAALNPKVRVA